MTEPCIIKQETLHLFERANIDGQCGMFPFDQDVFWVRHSESSVWLRHGGTNVLQLATYCDVGNRLLDSAERAFAHLKSACQAYSLCDTSTLECVIMSKVMDTPHTISKLNFGPNIIRSAHGDLVSIAGRGWFICDNDDTQPAGSYKPVEDRLVYSGTPLSSFDHLRGPVQAVRRLQVFIRQHREADEVMAARQLELT